MTQCYRCKKNRMPCSRWQRNSPLAQTNQALGSAAFQRPHSQKVRGSSPTSCPLLICTRNIFTSTLLTEKETEALGPEGFVFSSPAHKQGLRHYPRCGVYTRLLLHCGPLPHKHKNKSKGAITSTWVRSLSPTCHHSCAAWQQIRKLAHVLRLSSSSRRVCSHR